MPVTDWWLGANGNGWATVVCRSDSNDQITVACNGASFTGTPDTAVNDGVVSITVAGVGSERVAYSVDGEAGGTLRGARQSGPWTIASGSCWATVVPDVLAFQLLNDYDLDAYFALGDFPYCNSATTMHGETTVNVTTSIATATNPANYLAHHRQIRKVQGIKELKRSVPFYYMADDHEYPFDNARNDLTWWQTCPNESKPTATQTDLDNAWAACRGAITAYATGLPVNGDAGIDSDALYTRGTVGPVEWFLLDCLGYGSVPTAADNASKTMLGAAQKAWLIDRVTNSTATFKMIVSPKQFWRGGGNTDAWHAQGVNLGYQTELKEILYALRNVTGVFAIAGDQHRFTDQQVAADEIGPGYPAMSCLVGCPTSVAQNADTYAGYDSQIKFRDNGALSAAPAMRENVVALLSIEAGRVYRRLLSTQRGLISRGYIDAGSNVVQYPQTRFG